MAYADANHANRNAATLAAVALLEAGLIWAVITGLANRFVRPAPPTNPSVTNVPLDPPRPKPNEHTIHPPVAPPTTAPEEIRPVIDLPPLGPPVGGETGPIAEVAFPRPTPSPAITPLRPRPRGNPAAWVTENDYPTSEIRAEHEGVSRLRIAVDTAGKPAGCTVTASSGWPVLDATACDKIMRRARFDPATDSTGARAAGVFVTTVNWRLPD